LVLPFGIEGGCLDLYRDKKVVSVFVRFRAPLHLSGGEIYPGTRICTRW
jgi:hypothetical protein